MAAAARAAALALTLAAGLAGCTTSDGEVRDAVAAPSGACNFRPSPVNTGPRGDPEPSGTTVLGDGATLVDASVPSLRVEGKDVVVRDVEVEGTILVTGDDVVIDHVRAGGIAISSASRVRVERSEIAGGPGDGIHVTSDGPDLVQDVVLSHNLVHDPRVPPGAHYDGTQVRGVRGILVECSVYDAADYQDTHNSAIFIEDANGGAADVRIEHNWLLGSAWSLMIGTPGVTLTGNRVGGDIHWGTCHLSNVGEDDAPREQDNVSLETGRVTALCGPDAVAPN